MGGFPIMMRKGITESNIVKLEDGNWYEPDLTSTDAYDSKSYYCIPSSQMAKYHKRGGLMGKLTWIVPVTQE